MHCVKAFSMTEARPPPRNPSVRSVSINDVGNTILVGTQGSELFEITNIQATADITGATLLQRGHFAYELWGTCCAFVRACLRACAKPIHLIVLLLACWRWRARVAHARTCARSRTRIPC